jgi:hypothetical protein
MKNAAPLLMLFTILILCSCRSGGYRVPKTELCIIGEDVCSCRYGRKKYDRPWEECLNYTATNPDDYKQLRDWVDDKLNDLRRCKRRN